MRSEIRVFNLILRAICPACSDEFELDVSHDLVVHCWECHTCGMHEEAYFMVDCPSCGKIVKVQVSRS